MTFGLISKGDYSQLLFSTEAETLTFIGKATFTTRQGVPPGPVNGLQNNWAYYFYSNGVTYYNFPRGSIYNYTFNSGGRDVIFFVYAPYPAKCSLMRASKNANGTYDISVGSQNGGSSTYVPEVYCFAKANTVASGYGMNLYKSNGSIAFTTASKILIVKQYYAGTFQSSNIQNYQTRYSGSFVANSGNRGSPTITSIAPVDSGSRPVTKPILYLPSIETAVRWLSYEYWFYELLGSYNPSTTNLDVEWVNTATVFIFNTKPPTYQSIARNGFAMVADGADYD